MTDHPTQNSLVSRQIAESQGDLSTAESNKYMMILVRPGVGARKYMVPPGTTLSDLIREVDIQTANQDFMIGEEKITQETVLQPASVVFQVPRPKNA